MGLGKRIHISFAHPHSKKTSVAREQKRKNICNFSRTDFFCFLLIWRKSRKEVIYAKKNGGRRAFRQESKIAAKFSKQPSIRTVTSLRDISEETWIHSYPIMEVNFAFRRKVKMTATRSFVSLGDKMRELLVKK